MSKTIYVDVDGTICTNHSLKNVNPEEFKDIQSDYENAEPHRERIDYINSLYEKGNKIIYWTARGIKSGIDFKEFTKNQLKEWGAKYHGLDVEINLTLICTFVISPIIVNHFFNVH